MRRRTEESALRNSAKYIRNFGRSMATSSMVVAEKRPMRLFTKNTGPCEPATEVYGLTPARCWKVKGDVSASEALNPSPSKRRP